MLPLFFFISISNFNNIVSLDIDELANISGINNINIIEKIKNLSQVKII